MRNSIVAITAENAECFPERLGIVDQRGAFSYEEIWSAFSTI